LASLKIAIIGSGASAAGVLSGIEAACPNVEISVFSDERYFGDSPKERYATADVEQFYNEVYQDIKKQVTNFPPRKTFYGDPIQSHTIGGTERFPMSEMFGGLTNVWGGSVLPLSEEDLESWPIDRADLEPHYRAVARLVGVAGLPDRVSDFLKMKISNRPPVKQLKGFKVLQDYLNAHPGTDKYVFHAGVPRIAVDTRCDSPRRCIHCGECMAGCIRDSIYSSRNAFMKLIAQKNVRFIGKRVREVRIRNGKRLVYAEGGYKESFDKVFLAAGCVSTTEILMRSLNLESGPVLQDNAIYQYPIINLTRHADKEKDKYFGLTNLLVIAEPKRPDLPLLQVQLYPNADFLWRTIVPPWLWKVTRHPVRWSRDRILWARVYMDGADSYRFSVCLKGDGLIFEEECKPDEEKLAAFWESQNEVLKGSMFLTPPIKPVLAHTSAHLAGTFPYDGEVVDIARDSGVMPLPHVYIADSTCFPKSPVTSPTLTIMANARRSAVEALL
jgi:ferredoxin